MAHEHESDVLVAGAGPVGLMGALALANRGVQVRVFDEEWRETARSYGLAVHPGTLELLAQEGLAEAVVAKGHRVDRILFYDEKELRHEVSLAELGTPFPYAIVLPQHDLESLLAERLGERGTEVSWSHRVAGLHPADGTVEAEVQRLGKVSSGYAVASTGWVIESRFTHRSRFVLGADGHRSTVRRWLGLEWPERGASEIYAVFELTADRAEQHEACVVLAQDSTSVLWPLPGDRWRWSFQIADQRLAESRREKSRLAVQLGAVAFQGLSDEALSELIAERAPWFGGDVRDIRWSMVVRFERRLVEAFGRDRVWLAGDSAHLAGPVSVQSMNVGLSEAHDLAHRLSLILRGKGTADLLAEYDQQRLAEWGRLLALPTAESSGDGWLQRHRGRMLQCLPASGSHLETLAAQLR